MKAKSRVEICYLIFILMIMFQCQMTIASENYSLSTSVNVSGAIYLESSEYVHVRQHVIAIIAFSFQCQNPKAKVTAYLMDDDDFEGFQHGMGYSALYLSNGPRNSAFGRYEVSQEDDWNIVFLNEEAEPTILKYNLLFDNEDPLIYITPFLAFSLIFGVVIALYLITRSINVEKREDSISQ